MHARDDLWQILKKISWGYVCCISWNVNFSFHQMMGRKWSIVFCVFGRTGQARTSQARPGQMGCRKVDYNWGCVFSHLRFFWIKYVSWSGWSAKNGVQEGLGFNIIESVFSHIWDHFRIKDVFQPIEKVPRHTFERFGWFTWLGLMRCGKPCLRLIVIDCAISYIWQHFWIKDVFSTYIEILNLRSN